MDKKTIMYYTLDTFQIFINLFNQTNFSRQKNKKKKGVVEVLFI